MTVKQRKLVRLTACAALLCSVLPMAGAMHIMEGYLPVGFCVLWGVICLPFLAAGLMSIRKVINENRRVLILLAMSGAFIFVISSLKIPSWTGSCSHMTGTGLGAILFGPVAVSILGLIVLLFQAILLAHGGLTTLGANTFSMAVAGPLVSFGVYKLGKKLKLPLYINVFLAAFLGDLFTYCVTAVQLGLAQHADTPACGHRPVPSGICSHPAAAGSDRGSADLYDRHGTGNIRKAGAAGCGISEGGKMI